MVNNLIPSVAPVTQRVRAYFAPVNRAAAQASIFDASGIAGFNLNAPPAPWVDLGWCSAFTRRSGTKNVPLNTGAPGVVVGQVRTAVDAEVSLEFDTWGNGDRGCTFDRRLRIHLSDCAGCWIDCGGGLRGW
jgi:hypothetical protein